MPPSPNHRRNQTVRPMTKKRPVPRRDPRTSFPKGKPPSCLFFCLPAARNTRPFPKRGRVSPPFARPRTLWCKSNRGLPKPSKSNLAIQWPPSAATSLRRMPQRGNLRAIRKTTPRARIITLPSPASSRRSGTESSIRGRNRCACRLRAATMCSITAGIGARRGIPRSTGSPRRTNSA